MVEKRVLLIESGRFIGGVIHSLFKQQEQLIVLTESPTNSAELVEAVQKHNPDIIILDDTVQKEFLPKLLTMMTRGMGVRVVVVNTDSNQVDIYEKQQVPVHRKADFFAVL
jgi:chemotaxis response regulator CheB